jgi:hypothetical protein
MPNQDPRNVDKIWHGRNGIYRQKDRAIYRWIGPGFNGLREASEHFYNNEDYYLETGIDESVWDVLYPQSEWDSPAAQQLRLLEFQQFLAGESTNF